MPREDDRRRYDLLRLIAENEPVGSIRLVDMMGRRGYSIQDRTIRLMLSELDEAGLTEKVAGKGRRLTQAGRDELERGNVDARREQVRERIATLTSQVTYDPGEDGGEVVVSSGRIPPEATDAAFELLVALHDSPIGPVPVVAEEQAGGVQLALPSSITLGGVLLTRGINARLVTAGLVEYDGAVRRYIDVINGEGATLDVVALLIEAGRTDVGGLLEAGEGVLIVDNLEVPLTRYEETEDLSQATRDRLGGVVDLRRPRESGVFLPDASTGWGFASLTYGGVGETALALLSERDCVAEWDTLDGLRARSEFEPAPAVAERL